MDKHFSILYTLLASLTMSSSLMAVQKIPEEGGIGGSVLLGVASTSLTSNLITGSDLADLGKERIDSLEESPDSESAVSGLISGEINYTIAETRTQIFLGTALEDLVRYDFTFRLGIRQDFVDKSILSGGVLFSGIPSNVWSDPYVTGQDRDETERSSAGGFLGWSGIAGSGLEVEVSQRKNKDEQR